MAEENNSTNIIYIFECSSSSSLLVTLCCQGEKHHAASRKKTWHCWLRRPLRRDEIQSCSHPPRTLSFSFSFCHFLHCSSRPSSPHFAPNLKPEPSFFFLISFIFSLSLLAISAGAERLRAAVIASSYFACPPHPPPTLGAFPGGTSKIGHIGSHLGSVMNSLHNCLCHHVDFSIDTASLLFRVLSLNSTFPNKYSAWFKAEHAQHGKRRGARSARKAPQSTLSPKCLSYGGSRSMYIFTSGVHRCRHAKLIKPTGYNETWRLLLISGKRGQTGSCHAGLRGPSAWWEKLVAEEEQEKVGALLNSPLFHIQWENFEAKWKMDFSSDKIRIWLFFCFLGRISLTWNSDKASQDSHSMVTIPVFHSWP